jgi:hypothetical protein
MDSESQAVTNAIMTGLAQQPAALAAILQPQLTGITGALSDLTSVVKALVAVVDLVRPPLSQWATDDEVSQIRTMAKHLCRLSGKYTLQTLWVEYQRKQNINSSRLAFGKIPRHSVKPIFDDLQARLVAVRPTPVPEFAPLVITAIDRVANPKIDFDTEQVAAMLHEAHSFRIEPDFLSTAMGLYDMMPFRPLYLKSARRDLEPKAYLDQARYDFVEAWVAQHPKFIEKYQNMVASFSVEAREIMKHEERPIRGRPGWRRPGT